MPSRTPSRSASRGRSRSHTPRRSITPRSASRSRSAPASVRGSRQNGRRRDSRASPRGRARSDSRSPPPRRPSPTRSSKIVVEKLTKNINEEHLREIFGAYGVVKEVDMPMNRQFNTNRGTAYILYQEMAEAETAIVHMHEAQVDGAVINVSVVLPKRKFSRSPPPSRRLMSHLDRNEPRGPPSGMYREAPSGPGRHRSPPPRRESPRRDSPPPRRYPTGPARRGRDNHDTWRPRSHSRSVSPRRDDSRSYSRSPSRTPPHRYRGRGSLAYRMLDSTPPRRVEGRVSAGRGAGGRRSNHRSPSSSSYDSYSDRSRSRSRGPSGHAGRGGRR